MNSDLSILELVGNASPMVMLVMLLLLLASLMSWTVIFRKWRVMSEARATADEFEKRFWSGKDLGGLYAKLAAESDLRGMAAIFVAGFREYARLHKQPGIQPMHVVEGTQRSMRVSLSREVESLEANLPFLATVGSTSPYIGLFGTVWGIMNSFHALGGTAQQATLAMVAPGISEALVATAMGLFAAIPAVIAYNRYTHDTDRLVNRYDNFLEEFSSVLQRQVHA